MDASSLLRSQVLILLERERELDGQMNSCRTAGVCQWGRVVQKKPILNRTIDFEAKRIQFCRFESRGRAKRQFHYDWSKVQESLANLFSMSMQQI